MPDSEKPLVYLVLGTAGAGRRDILADLIAGGLVEGDRAAVLLSDSETPAAADARLPGLARWTWHADARVIAAELPADATHVFLVADGRRNPVDQLEAFRPWCEAAGAELARVFCVVDCALAEKTPALLPWFEACVHFSDIVLLTRREAVANKWLSDFQTHFKKQFLPCLFELVKSGRVKNPALVLTPEARRMSHAFDAEPDWIFTNADGIEFGEDDDEAVADNGKADEEITAEPAVDEYFVRDAAGKRVKKIPDVGKFLSGETP